VMLTCIVQIDDKVDDKYFGKTRRTTRTSAEEEFFEDGKPKAKEGLSESKTSDQKTIDKEIVAKVKKTADLAKYLKASFGLTKGQFPHQLVF